MKAHGFLGIENAVTIPKPRSDGKQAVEAVLRKMKDKIVIGINAANRTIIQNNAGLIILASNINPPSLIEHILFMCANKKIPVVSTAISQKEMGKILGYKQAAVVAIPKKLGDEVINLLQPFSQTLNETDFKLYTYGN